MVRCLAFRRRHNVVIAEGLVEPFGKISPDLVVDVVGGEFVNRLTNEYRRIFPAIDSPTMCRSLSC